MKELFLTCDKKSKKLYNSILKQTSKAIADAFTNESAYSGPTPDQLKEIIRQDSILPEHGLGWDKIFELTKEKVLPNLLRTPSTEYMPHLHGPSLLETLSSELIISTFNQSMDSWDQSPVAKDKRYQ